MWKLIILTYKSFVELLTTVNKNVHLLQSAIIKTLLLTGDTAFSAPQNELLTKSSISVLISLPERDGRKRLRTLKEVLQRNRLYHLHFFCKFPSSVTFAVIRNSVCATDESKLWFCLSAKQRWHPCSGPPPVYHDLSMCHDWPVKKGIVSGFANQDERKFVEFVGGREQGSRCCFADVTNQG